MKQTSINHKGFAVIETLLVLLIAAIIGGTGYYVYQSYDKSTDTQNTAHQNAKSATPPGKKDPTKDWTAYTSTAGKFSLKYPATWVQPTNKDLCNPDTFDRTLYLGSDSASVLKCATEFFGQMNVTSLAGNQLAENGFDASLYKDIASKDVTVDGVKGKRTSGVVKEELMGGSPVGTTVIKYSFYTSGNTYVATYVQAPKGDAPSNDVLDDFDLMATKTLKFE